jgi:hypothetical protein
MLLSVGGCELVASFDRDAIPTPGLQIPDAMVVPPGPVIEAGLPEIEAGMDAGLDAGDAAMDAGFEDAGDESDAGD